MTSTAEQYTPTSEFLEDESIEPRDKGIGGSDIATIVGLNPFASTWDLWATLTGRKKRFSGNVATSVGTKLEPYVADEYRLAKNVQLVGPVASTLDGIIRRSPDRLMLNEKAILEVKTSLGFGARKMWGSDEVEGIPDYYNCQGRWYMSMPYDLSKLSTYEDFDAIETYCLMNSKIWAAEYIDYAVFMTGPEHRYYRLYHDQEISDTLLEEAEKFWKKHILRDIEPDPDGSTSAAKHISQRFKEATQEMKKPSVEIDPVIQEYRKLAILKKTIDRALSKRRQYIQTFIGEDRGVHGDFGKITWYTQARKTFDKDALYQMLMKHIPREVIDQCFATANKVKDTRVFLSSWSDTNDPTIEEVSSCLD
jgi:putative phage-type endonuclease